MTLLSLHLKRSVGVVFGFLLLCAALPVHAEEYIPSFVSEAAIREDGSVRLVETITYDFGSSERHGIFRTLHSRHPHKANAWYKERYIDYDVVSVTRNGVAEPYTEEESRAGVFLRIGDPDRTITGSHIYRIELVLHGALSYGDEPEFYYNVTGHEWEVVMEDVTVSVTPASFLKEGSYCYEGPYASRELCSASTTPEGVSFHAENVYPGEGVTLAQAIDASKVGVEVQERINPLLMFLLIPAPLMLLFLVWFSIRTYRHETEFHGGLPVIAQYEPYPGVLPMYTGVLMDGALEPHDVAAGIVYLAIQGHLKIHQTERTYLFFFNNKDYDIELLKDVPADAPESAREILSFIFSRDAHGNYTVGERVALSELHKDKVKAIENSKRFIAIGEAAKRDLTAAGFYQHYSGAEWLKTALTVLIPLALYALAALLLLDPAFVLPALSIPVAVIVISAITLYRRLTRKGYVAENHLAGFKRFLSVTEKERLAFHNAPEKNPEIFMACLPYAIALGVEHKWAELFKDVVMPPVPWYDGGAGNNIVSTMVLTDALSNFSLSMTSVASVSAGSSGGGSSGGGGGGGGGGSW